jgi:hypothetical protein
MFYLCATVDGLLPHTFSHFLSLPMPVNYAFYKWDSNPSPQDQESHVVPLCNCRWLATLHYAIFSLSQFQQLSLCTSWIQTLDLRIKSCMLYYCETVAGLLAHHFCHFLSLPMPVTCGFYKWDSNPSSQDQESHVYHCATAAGLLPHTFCHFLSLPLPTTISWHKWNSNLRS